MGYEVDTVVFYGVEIEKPVTNDMNALYATVDEHFVHMLGNWNTDEARYFIVRAPTFRRVASDRIIEAEVINITSLVLNEQVHWMLEGHADLQTYAFMHELKIVGQHGWIVGAYGC